MPAATVRAFAKVNLTLEVLNRRPDGFHNLRTIFQTISLHDRILVEVNAQAPESGVEVVSDVEIPGENLIGKAVRAVLEATGSHAAVQCRLEKRIPMGGGLGGGSTDAAAVLLALPELLRVPLTLEQRIEIGSALGSDVPFFLLGGTVLGVGRGTELYPLAPAEAKHGLLVAPPVHVSTAEAYRGLRRTENNSGEASFSPAQRLAVSLSTGQDWAEVCVNDFEASVFAAHPQLSRLRERLAALGATVARMSGSGATLFGLFSSGEKRDDALRALASEVKVLPFEFVSARNYAESYARALPSGPILE